MRITIAPLPRIAPLGAMREHCASHRALMSTYKDSTRARMLQSRQKRFIAAWCCAVFISTTVHSPYSAATAHCHWLAPQQAQ